MVRILKARIANNTLPRQEDIDNLASDEHDHRTPEERELELATLCAVGKVSECGQGLSGWCS